LQYTPTLYVTDDGQLGLGQGAPAILEELDGLATPVWGKEFPVLLVLRDDLCGAWLRHAGHRSSAPGTGRTEYLLECGPDDQ
jgi:hypothetical protein